MATAEAFRSSTTRAVGLRKRGDLHVNRQLYQGQAWFVVKDPISLHYFRFRPEEYALLEMLDGQVVEMSNGQVAPSPARPPRNRAAGAARG